MTSPINEDEFGELLATFGRSAFRLEAQPAYALGYERSDFERFLAGHPQPPEQSGWWQSWLDQIAGQVAEGKTISRVRVLADPPSDYQRWEIWGDPWHAAVGEQIRYLPVSHAVDLGVPLDHDWWFLDDERLIVMRFTSDGEIASKTITSEPETITRYRQWRDLAVRHATPAEQFAAA